MTASNDVAVDCNGDTVGNGHCEGGQWPLLLPATAAVTVSNGICDSRQRQAKATAAMATAMVDNSSCNSGRWRAKAAAKTGDGRFLDDRQWLLGLRVMAALTVGNGHFDIAAAL